MQGRLRNVRRAGRFSIVDLEGVVCASVASRIDALGVGRYQFAVFVAIGFFAMCESLQMGAISSLHAALGRAFNLSPSSRAWLVAVTYAGEGVGTILAGPMCDLLGRRLALLTSNITIVLAMYATGRLPTFAPLSLLVALRFLSGAAVGMGAVAACVLAVESCPTSFRARLMFGLTFMGSLGYLLSAVGLHIYMPHFGEEPTDRWRQFCLFMSVPAMVSVCLVSLLCESPSFLAVRGDVDKCVSVLNTIAASNGHGAVGQIQLPAPLTVEQQEREQSRNVGQSWMQRITFAGMFVSSYVCMLALLSMIDVCRSFFVGGFSYILKDIYNAANVGSVISGTMINIIASLAPLFGILLAQPFLWLGIRRVAVAAAGIAAFSMAALVTESVRSMPIVLLSLVMAAKLSFGPLAAAVSLFKAESFPTEVRASAFAFVTVFARVGCTAAPTLVELLKDDSTSDLASNDSLSVYIFVLMCSVVLCGVSMLFVPGSDGSSVELEDYVVKAVLGHKNDSLTAKDSHDIWQQGETDGSSSDGTSDSSRNYGSTCRA